ncbi:unnamed protein product, partial [marine sediment metagenome]
NMNKLSDLNVGRAGEFLVIADLLLQGQKCFLTDQGLNYDVVVEINDKLIRGQVKTTKEMRVLHQNARPIYFFHIRRAGKGGIRQYSLNEFEFFALVALDIRQVFYLPFDGKVGSASICIRDKNIKYQGQAKGGKKNGLYYQDLTWENFINGYNSNN